MVERETIIAENPIQSYMESRGHSFIRIGKEFACICPFHADKSPSFRVNVEKSTWFCDPCNMGGSVIDLVMKMESLDVKAAMQKLSGEVDVTPSSKLQMVAEYSYNDENGKLAYQVIRFTPKTFRQRRMINDKWVWGMDGVRRILYQLPEVMESNQVMIVEGEKDADCITALGLVATCNVGGAGKWLAPYADFLSGKDVILCPDNDEVGKKHMDTVAESLTGKVKSLRRIEVPTPHKDVYDFVMSFESKEIACKQLLSMMTGSKKVYGGIDIPIHSMDELEEDYRQHVKDIKVQSLNLGCWLPTLGKHVRGLVPGELVAVVADTSVGKTAIAQNIALACNPLPTLIFELELPGTLTFERFLSLRLKRSGRMVETMYATGENPKWKDGNKLDHIFVCSESRMTPEKIEDLIKKSPLRIGKKPVLVIVDYLQLMAGKGTTRYEKASDAAEELKRIAKSTGTIIIFTSQVGRKKEDAVEIGLHDGKDSGSIENSSGVSLGCWRDPEDRSKIFIRINKNTKGPTGAIVQARFDGETLAITEGTGL